MNPQRCFDFLNLGSFFVFIAPFSYWLYLVALKNVPANSKRDWQSVSLLIILYRVKEILVRLTCCNKFFVCNVYSHKKKRKYSADTSLQQRRQEKNMVDWL
jgi:hypothetical protein